MPVLYVTEPGAVVRVAGDSLTVTLDKDPDGKEGPAPQGRRILIEVEPHRLEGIALVGRAHITSDAQHLCLEKGIDIAWLTRNGRLLGRVVPLISRTGDLRIAQYAAHLEPERRLCRARSVVAAKVRNAAEVLRDIQSNTPGDEPLARAIASLAASAERALSVQGPQELLGVEGAAAAEYFKAFGRAFRGEIRFETRQRRPPPDPVNALLSFGYVLLGKWIEGATEARGLDPTIGFFHEMRAGRPSLALDLLEEMRHPVVDRFVLRSCNLRIFRPEMFEADPEESGGVRMTPDALKTFFGHWEKHCLQNLREQDGESRVDVRALLRRQVDRLADDLRGVAAYAPFVYGG